jgi:hypothetical protein
MKPIRIGTLCIVFMFLIHGVAEATSGCRIMAGLDNGDRFSWGPFWQECNSFPWWHTAPFGNWGVDTPVSDRSDSFEWAGWKDLDGWQQWNTCTTDYPPPSSDNYNYNNFTSQASDFGWQTHGHGFLYGTPTTSCEYLNGVIYTMEENSNDIYELDADGDDLIGTIVFPEQSFPLSCSGYYTSATSYGEASTYVNPILTPGILTGNGWSWASGSWGSW